MTLRNGEVLISKSAGGPCAVCKGRIQPGQAVQLSKWSARIRHVECLPKSDTREGQGGKLNGARTVVPG